MKHPEVILVFIFAIVSMLVLIFEEDPNTEILKQAFSQGEIDLEFQPYVDEFISHYGRPIHPIKIKMIEDPVKNRVAFCSLFAHRAIYVAKAYWSIMDVCDRETVIFHELGHCELNRDHDDRPMKENKNLPISWMHSSADFPCSTEFYKYRDYYVEELFHGPY